MQQFPQTQMQTKYPVLVFIKLVGPPIILYVDDHEKFYQEIIDIIKQADEKNPQLIEKIANGPVTHLSVLDTQIAAVAIQEEKIPTYLT